MSHLDEIKIMFLQIFSKSTPIAKHKCPEISGIFLVPLLWKYIGKYFLFYAFQRTWGWVHARTKQMETVKNMVTTECWCLKDTSHKLCLYQHFCITNLQFWKGKPITGVARKKWQTVERVDLSVDVGPFWHLVGDQFNLIAGTGVLNEILRICYFLLLGKSPSVG